MSKNIEDTKLRSGRGVKTAKEWVESGGRRTFLVLRLLTLAAFYFISLSSSLQWQMRRLKISEVRYLKSGGGGLMLIFLKWILSNVIRIETDIDPIKLLISDLVVRPLGQSV
jgi:hypothetical protein